jgi:uncharacterized phosphosugar-binding protein
MAPLAATYFTTVAGLLKHAYKTNGPLLRQLGPVIGRSVASGGVVHAFGSGHSEIIAREIVGRAGGLACVSAIGDATGGFAENLAGYGTKLAERHDRLYGLRSGETIIVISNSGRSASAIEVALYAKQKGLTVVGLTSAAMARTAQTIHPAGRNLPAVADYVLDNCGVRGDAIVDIAHDVRAGPTSTLAGTMLLNLLFLEVVEWLKTNGYPLPILRSQNLPGAIESNRALVEKYAGRLSKPLA